MLQFQRDKYLSLTAVDRSGIYSIFMKIAERMVDEHISYYSFDLQPIRDTLFDPYGVGLIDFKYREGNDRSYESIDDMSQEEQLMFVLLAAEIILAGDSPE